MYLLRHRIQNFDSVTYSFSKSFPAFHSLPGVLITISMKLNKENMKRKFYFEV